MKTFFGLYSVILKIILKFFKVTQETIIHRLVMRNHVFYAFLKKNCWRENGRGHHGGAKGSGVFQTRPKS